MPVRSRDDQVPAAAPGYGARSPPAPSSATPSGVSLSSVRGQPALTPRLTFDDDGADVIGGLRGTVREVRFDEGLEEDERGCFDADQDADDENEDDGDARSVQTASLAPSTPSQPALDSESSWPWHTEQTLATKRMSYPRSSSLPPNTATVSQPTLSSSPPPSLESSVNVHEKKRRARVEDDSSTNDLVFRRSNLGSSQLRRRSAPPAPLSRNASFGSLLNLQDSCFSSESDQPMTEREREDLKEIAATVGIFEEGVDELSDAAEENVENRGQMQHIADEVRETMLEDREDELWRSESGIRLSRIRVPIRRSSERGRRSAALDRTAIDYEEELELRPCPALLNRRQGNSADDDVDESVAAMRDDNFGDIDSEFDGERRSPSPSSRRSLIFDEDEPELRSPPLEPVADEESESSTDTVRIIKPASPDVQFGRRVSDLQAYASLIAKEYSEIKKRRASMSDFCAIKGILKLPAKAAPAATVVTACAVRPAEQAKLSTVHERPRTQSRPKTLERQSAPTAHTVRSNSGVLQML